MGAWPLARCQEQQQCCHRQKDTREAPGTGKRKDGAAGGRQEARP